MHSVVVVCVFLSAVAQLTLTAKLPSAFPVCQKNAPDANVCLRNAVEKAFPLLAKGIPSLNLPPLDPLEVSAIEINQGSGPIVVKMRFTNTSIFGLAKTKIPRIVNNVNAYELNGVGVVGEVVMESDYVMDGRFLVLPVRGSGKCRFTVSNIEAEIILTGKPKTKKGQVYMDIQDFNLKINKISGMTIKLENLFNGDKRLGDSMNRIMNENWSEFWKALKPDFETTFASVCYDYSRRIFGKIPYKEIFLS